MRSADQKSETKYLVILLFLFFIKSVLWLFLIPIFQSPDENRHYDYIINLAKLGKLPVGTLAKHEVQETFMQETVFLEKVSQFDLVHFSPKAKTTFIFKDDSLWTAVNNFAENDSLSNIADPENISVNYYPPLYHIFSAVVYNIIKLCGGNILIRFYFLRLLQIIFSLLTALFAWKILDMLNFNLYFKSLFLLIYTFWPQLGMYTVGLQPDVLAMLLITMTTFLVVENHIKKSKLFYVKLGTLLSGLFYVKFHFFLVNIIIICFVYLFTLYIKTKKIDLKIGISLAILLLMASPWLVFNLRHYHTLLPPSFTLGGKMEGLSIFRKFWFFLSVSKRSTFPTAIAWFGWRDAKMPNLYYYLYYILIATSGISFIFFLFRSIFSIARQIIKRNIQKVYDIYITNVPYFFIYFPFFLFCCLIIYLGMAISPYLVDQGRHYFAFIFAALLLFMHYAHKIFRNQKFADFYLLFLAIFVFVSHIFAFIMVLYRYYVPGFVIL